MTTFHSIWTLLLLISFVGIVLWAWSSKRKTAFEVAARTPLDDEILEQENKNG